MRIALVVHAFPPARLGGTEVYALSYARALLRAGHAVSVFAAVKDVSRDDLSVRIEESDGLRIHWVTSNLFLGDFRETFDRPAVDERFARFLDAERPDLVHAMHVADLSAGLLARACAAGIPVGLTLHDYWITCPRWGQRWHPEGRICETIDRDVCAACIALMPWRQPRGAAAAGRAIAGWKRWTGIDVAGPAKRTLRALRGKRRVPAASRETASPPAEVAGIRARLDERAGFLRDWLVPSVDLFLAPTAFLAEELMRHGLPRERTRVSRIGIDREALDGLVRSTSPRVRVAFHGSIQVSKGPLLLARAWGSLPASVRGRATLAIRGAVRDDGYGEEVRAAAEAAGATLEPEFGRSELPDRLSRTDLLVVPSVWWENSPLSILEAQAARVPLLVSDLGGMAELVPEGAGGYRFRPGDAEDLSRSLALLIDDPGRRAACVAAPVPVRSIDEDARELPARILDARTTLR